MQQKKCQVPAPQMLGCCFFFVSFHCKSNTLNFISYLYISELRTAIAPHVYNLLLYISYILYNLDHKFTKPEKKRLNIRHKV